MSITMETVLAIAIGVVGFLAIFNIGTALTAAAFRIPILRIQFGFPPAFRLFRIGQTDVSVSPILLGGHVKFRPPEDGSPFAPWPVRFLVALAGPASALVLCAIPLGARVIDEALLAWPQLLAIATDFSTPVDVVSALQPALQSGGLLAAAAVVAVKAAMFNLVPLPFLGGGALLEALFSGLRGGNRHFEWPQLFLSFSLVGALAFTLFTLFRIVTVT